MFASYTKKDVVYWLLFAWFCKLMAAIILGYIYQNFYATGDTFSLFEDGKRLYILAKENPSTYVDMLLSTLAGEKSAYGQVLLNPNPRAVLMAIFNSLLIFVVGNNYWLVAILAASLNFFSALFLIKQLGKIFLIAKAKLYIAFFFFPSVLLWSSGLLKENLLTAGLYLALALYLNICFSTKQESQYFKKSIYVLLLAVLLFLLFRLKYYYAAVFAPLLIAHYIVKKFPSLLKYRFNKQQKKYLQIGLFLSVFSLMAFAATNTHPNLKLESIMGAIVKNNEKMVSETSNKTNLIVFQNLQAAAGSFIKKLPQAFFQGLIRPYLWESGHILKRLVAIENTVILIMIFHALYRFFTQQKSTNNYLEIFAIFLYCTVMLSLLAMAAPNLGTLARYKVGFLPFLLLIILPSNFKYSLK